MASRATEARVAAESRVVERGEGPECGMADGGRGVGVGEECGEAVADVVVLEVGPGEELGGGAGGGDDDLVAAGGEGLTDDRQGSGVAEVAEADQGRVGEGVSRVAGDLQEPRGDIRPGRAAQARIAAAFQARSLLVCQIAAARGSPSARRSPRGPRRPASRRAAAERCSIARHSRRGSRGGRGTRRVGACATGRPPRRDAARGAGGLLGVDPAGGPPWRRPRAWHCRGSSRVADGGDQASVGDAGAGRGEGEPLLRGRAAGPGLKRAGAAISRRAVLPSRVDLEGDVEPGLVLPREPGRDQLGGLGGVEPAEGPAGGLLDVGRGVEGQGIVGPSDLVLPVGQRGSPRAQEPAAGSAKVAAGCSACSQVRAAGVRPMARPSRPSRGRRSPRRGRRGPGRSRRARRPARRGLSLPRPMRGAEGPAAGRSVGGWLEQGGERPGRDLADGGRVGLQVGHDRLGGPGRPARARGARRPSARSSGAAVAALRPLQAVAEQGDPLRRGRAAASCRSGPRRRRAAGRPGRPAAGSTGRASAGAVAVEVVLARSARAGPAAAGRARGGRRLRRTDRCPGPGRSSAAPRGRRSP